MAGLKEYLSGLGPGKIVAGLCGAAAFVAAFAFGSSMGPILSDLARLVTAIFHVFGRLLP